MLRRSARAHRDKHKTGGEQRRHDQRIGAAMRVFGVAHAVGQARAAPEIDEIEPALKRKQRVEQDQRARHRLRRRTDDPDRKARGYGGGARVPAPGRLRRMRRSDQGPDGADDQDPESDPLGVENGRRARGSRSASADIRSMGLPMRTGRKDGEDAPNGIIQATQRTDASQSGIAPFIRRSAPQQIAGQLKWAPKGRRCGFEQLPLPGRGIAGRHHDNEQRGRQRARRSRTGCLTSSTRASRPATNTAVMMI